LRIRESAARHIRPPPPPPNPPSAGSGAPAPGGNPLQPAAWPWGDGGALLQAPLVAEDLVAVQGPGPAPPPHPGPLGVTRQTGEENNASGHAAGRAAKRGSALTGGERSSVVSTIGTGVTGRRWRQPRDTVHNVQINNRQVKEKGEDGCLTHKRGERGPPAEVCPPRGSGGDRLVRKAGGVPLPVGKASPQRKRDADLGTSPRHKNI